MIPDEDLAGMYLTDKKAGKPREISNHQTAELLLEYCKYNKSLYHEEEELEK